MSTQLVFIIIELCRISYTAAAIIWSYFQIQPWSDFTATFQHMTDPQKNLKNLHFKKYTFPTIKIEYKLPSSVIEATSVNMFNIHLNDWMLDVDV